jgi:hypothetical protein
MVRRLLGLGSFVIPALWIYFWEWIRSQLYERAQHMLAPYFEWVTPDTAAKYLPPLLFVMAGLWLFWSTRPESRTIKPAAKLPDPNPTGRSPSIRAPIIKIGVGASKLSQAAPWLELYCNGYNATGYNIFFTEVSGRIKIGAEEFHGQIEFDRKEFTYPVDEFYNLSLRVPLTATEAEFCRNALAEGGHSLEFVGASITAAATSRPANSMFDIRLTSVRLIIE